MRLRAERDLRPERVDTSLADRRLERRGAALEIVLAPRPAAAQRRRAVEPHHRTHAARGGVRRKPEHRAVVEEHVDVVLGTRRGRRRRIHRHAHDRARDVELVAAQRTIRLSGLPLHQEVGHRQLQRRGDRRRRRPRGDHHAAGLDELPDVRFGRRAAARSRSSPRRGSGDRGRTGFPACRDGCRFHHRLRHHRDHRRPDEAPSPTA